MNTYRVNYEIIPEDYLEYPKIILHFDFGNDFSFGLVFERYQYQDWINFSHFLNQNKSGDGIVVKDKRQKTSMVLCERNKILVGNDNEKGYINKLLTITPKFKEVIYSLVEDLEEFHNKLTKKSKK